MVLKGWRTLIVGVIGVVGMPVLEYLTHFDWTLLGVTPTVAFVISGVTMLAMRYVSNTPMFSAIPDKKQIAEGVAQVLVTDPKLSVEGPGTLSLRGRTFRSLDLGGELEPGSYVGKQDARTE